MSFDVRPLEPIGAELRGVDLGDGISDADFAALEAALLAHGLLVLRDQDVEPEVQAALGRRFGAIEGQEFTSNSKHPDLIVIANVDRQGQLLPADHPFMRSIRINEQWHTDSSFRPVPASVSIFHARVVPPVGGDTFYASLRRAWLDLDDETRARLRGRRAIHDYPLAYRRSGGPTLGLPGTRLEPVPHPMARRHPVTGETVLFVSGHAWGVEGMEPDEGRAWIEELLAFATRDEVVYRHRWRVGDLLLWDNRCMLHKAQGFDAVHPRVMHHVRVGGDGPVIPA